jgi:LCP family protein required for cell wall assembly
MSIVGGILVALIASGAVLAYQITHPEILFTSQPPVKTPTITPIPTEAPDDQAMADAATVTPEPTPTEEPPPDYQFGKDRINVLVLGNDSSIERIEAGMNFRTDVMMLVSVDLVNHDVDLISIPRDSYVRINGGSQRTKINAAFVYGGGANKDGYQYAMDTVSWVFGDITIDYYVGFGMQVVKDVVDAMGGIDFDVDIDFTMNGRKTEKGFQHLDGQKALDYARYRGGGRGDIDRVDRQQRIIFAMFEQMKSRDQIKNIPAVYTAVMNQIDTNLDFIQVAALAYWARDLTMDGIDRHTLDGYGLMISNISYYVLDQDKKKELVKDIFGIDITIPEGEDYATIKSMAEEIATKVSELSVLVYNVSVGIYNGDIIDPAAQAALVVGQSAIMTEKQPDVDNALTLLRPYAYYTPTYNDPSMIEDPFGGQDDYGWITEPTPDPMLQSTPDPAYEPIPDTGTGIGWW